MNYDLLRVVNNGANIQDMNLRVVDYVRVSTASREQRKSFENQLDTYRQMIEDNPNWTYSGTYSDEAVSGTKVYLRGGFQQMIADAQSGLFDLVIVKDVARFARNIKECLVYKDKLKSCGVMIWFVKEGINSFRSKDEMFLQWMALGAEMEAENARSRTKIVFEQGIQRGKVYGNSKILGYTKDHCKLVVDEEEAETVRLIFDLYVHKRMGLRRIAKELVERGITRKDGTQIPTRTLKTVLENPKYKGFYCGGKTEKLDMGERYVRRELPQNEWVMYKAPAIPAIVSEALWDEAAQIRKERQGKYREEVSAPCNQGIYRYSGKIISGFDAAPGVSFTRCLYRYKGISREGWQCRNHNDAAHPGNVGPTLYSDELDTIVQGMLHDLLGGYDAMISDLMHRYRTATTEQQVDKRMATLKKEQAAIEKKRRKLLDLYEDDVITKDEYVARGAEHKARLEALQTEVEALSASSTKSQQLLEQLDELKHSVSRMVDESIPSKETIDSLIDKIVVLGDSTKKAIYLEITLKFVSVTQTFQIVRNRKQKDASCICCNQRISMYR